MKKIIISGQSGLANRLRCIASYIAYALKMNFNIYICWEKSNIKYEEQHEYARMQDRSFSDFFDTDLKMVSLNEIPIIDHIYSEFTPMDPWYKTQSSGQKLWISNGTKACITKIKDNLPEINCDIILVETSLQLKYYIDNGETKYISNDDISEIYFKYLKPKKIYLDFLNKYNDIDYGFSIRGHEFLKFYPETKYIFAPGNMTLINWLKNFKNFIIFSDDHFFRDFINNQLENPIEIDRSQFENWENAFIEFLFLALKCKIIYGTRYSSFAEQAAIFGKKEYRILLE